MTVLIDKATRDAAGIDSYERGFVWAALTLRAVLTAPDAPAQNPYLNWVRITWNANRLITANNGIRLARPFLIIQAKLPYRQQSALYWGGNWHENIEVFGTVTPPPPQFTCDPTEPNPFPIAADPVWVTTLEAYFAWCGLTLHKRLITTPGNPNTAIVQPAFFEEASPRYFQLNATLPFNWDKWHETRNLLCSLRTIPGYQGLNNDFTVDNVNLFSNQFPDLDL